MKLAEALIARADLKNKVTQIKLRMAQNVKVEEGDEPAEEANTLFRRYDALMAELEKIIIRINRTNAAIEMDGGTLADAIAKRDNLKAKINTYRELIEKASTLRERGYERTIKFVCCLDISELRKQADDLSMQYRELDTKMQGLNWTVNLL